MAEHGRRHRLRVVGHDVVAAPQVRPRAGDAGQEDRRTRRRTELDQVLEVCQADPAGLSRREGQLHDVVEHLLLQMDARDGLTRAGQLLHRGDRLDRLLARCCDATYDRLLLVLRRIPDLELQREAIELRLGERIRSVQFDRVLRGQHHEWLVEWIRLSCYCDLALLH